MQLLAALLGLGSTLVAVIALVALIRPLRRLGLKTRKRALGVLTLSFVTFTVAAILSPPPQDSDMQQAQAPHPSHNDEEIDPQSPAKSEMNAQPAPNAEPRAATPDEDQQSAPDPDTSLSENNSDKFLVHEFHIVENKDISVARRKRNMVKIFSQTALSPEALIATAMEAAVQIQRSEWTEYLTVFVMTTRDPASDSLAQIDFAPDGCGVSGTECTGQMWVDPKAVSKVPTPRQIAIVEAQKKHESSFREVISWKIDSSGFDIVTRKLKPLYDQLMEFKDREDFKVYGFSAAGPYNRWLVEVKRTRDETDERLLFSKWNISFGDLISLGFMYLHSKGKETNDTKAHMERFSLAFSSKSGERKGYEVNVRKLREFLAEEFGSTPDEVEREEKAYWAALFSKKSIELPQNLTNKGAILEENKDEYACRLDLQCWGNRKSLEAIFACQDLIENLGQYDHEWTDGILEPKFSHFRWKSRSKGIITYMGDKILFQNGFGAWMPHRYSCDYDTLNKDVLNVDAQAGRM